MGTLTYTDEEIQRIEAAREVGGPAAEAAAEEEVRAERAARESGPSREEIDAERATLDEQRAKLEADLTNGSGLDPEIGEETTPGGAQLTFGVGGKRPTSVSLRIAGGKVDVTEEIKKGRLVRVVQEMRVGELHFVDKVDSKTGQVTACERRQILKPTAPPTIEHLD